MLEKVRKSERRDVSVEHTSKKKKKTPEHFVSLNEVQACLNNWHDKHICIQKP